MILDMRSHHVTLPLIMIASALPFSLIHPCRTVCRGDSGQGRRPG